MLLMKRSRSPKFCVLTVSKPKSLFPEHLWHNLSSNNLRCYSAIQKPKEDCHGQKEDMVSVNVSALISPQGLDEENATEPQEPLILLCESSRVKGKGAVSSILLKSMWKRQAGLFSSSVLTSEASVPSRMLLSPPYVMHEHRTSTAAFSGCISTAVPVLQPQIPSLSGSVLTLISVCIDMWISSSVFL